MEKLIMSRQTGKTIFLIRKSAETGDVIVCIDDKSAKIRNDTAQSMGLTIPYPITFRRFISGDYLSKDIKGFLIDDADMLLESISNGIPINAISMVKEANRQEEWAEIERRNNFTYTPKI